MMWTGKKKIWTGLCLLCIFLFAGCGQAEQEQRQEQQEETSETQEEKAEVVFYYQSRQIETPTHAQGLGGWIIGSNITEKGLYYLFQPLYGLDKSLKLYQVPVTELFGDDVLSGNYAAVQPLGLTQELPLPESLENKTNSLIFTEYCWYFFQGQDKDLYYLTYNTEQKKNYLYHIDAEGQELAQIDVTEALQDMPLVEEITEGYMENSSCAADTQGQVYLTDKEREKLWILNAQGELLMQLSLPEETQQLTVLPDGQVYLTTGQGAASSIKRLDNESGSIEDVMDMPQTTGTGILVPGDGSLADGKLLYRDYSGLYSCDPGQGSAELLVTWDELEISGKNILQVRQMPTGKLYVWADDYRLTQVSPVLAADIPAEKQTVTVATLSSTNTLEPIVAEFNKHNAYYEAVIVEYDYFEGPQKLETELATGKAPDLLDIQLIYPDKLVDKGLLADLSPYLEDGKGIERQDLVEAVLRCNTIDGVLTCIPDSFALEVLVGKPQLLGSAPGWTIEEYTDCIRENRGLEIMGSNRFSNSSNQSGHSIVELPMHGDIVHWADFRQGEARFDQEDFRELLELAGDYKVTQPAVDLWDLGELQEGRMLTYVTALYDMKDYLLMNAALQQDIVYKGYPTGSGSPAYSLAGRNGYAINAASQVSDGAWALIEFIMTYSFSDKRSYTIQDPITGSSNSIIQAEYFSVFESQLAFQMSQSMVKVYQKDQNYDVVCDEEGQPVEVSKYEQYDLSGHVVVESLAARAEDVENLRRLIDAASSPSSVTGDTLFQIVYEEIDIYLSGQRSARETVDIIQSRVQLFLDENK